MADYIYENVFETRDFYSSCALRATGFKLLQLDFNPRGIATFVFADPDNKAEQTISQYWNKELKGDLRLFTEAINEFKSRIANRS